MECQGTMGLYTPYCSGGMDDLVCRTQMVVYVLRFHFDPTVDARRTVRGRIATPHVGPESTRRGYQ